MKLADSVHRLKQPNLGVGEEPLSFGPVSTLDCELNSKLDLSLIFFFHLIELGQSCFL